MDVGIRELKAKLSEYLHRAADGEEVIVTDRGQPIVRLVSYNPTAAIEKGIEDGWITPPSGGPLDPVQRHSARGSILDVLGDDRR